MLVWIIDSNTDAEAKSYNKGKSYNKETKILSVKQKVSIF